MGNFKLRIDKTCLNCGHVVEKKYCPNCGQENKETKESFHYLFLHTIEDLVHYDSSFWKTIKLLLFHPAILTKEYLSGKRKKYVAPVKLYIFISFITFFILSLLPATETNNEAVTKNTQKETTLHKKEKPFIQIKELEAIKSVEEYDSIQKTLPESQRASGLAEYFEKHLIKVYTENTQQEFSKKLIADIFKSIPKALFIIMPLFALIIWLFHNKQKWYYFDHGVFTLHYFSMLLLSFTILSLLEWLFSLFSNSINLSSVLNFLIFMLLSWWLFYFYRSHSKMYGESKSISRIKATAILFINLILISFILFILLVYIALNVN